jgi:hypothetical protein
VATIYPSGIDNNITLPRTIDLVTPVKAEVVNNNRDTIIVIENELGIDPSREFGTVRARLDYMTGLIEAVSGGLNTVSQDGVDIVSPATSLNFTGSVTVTDGGSGQANVEIIGGGDAEQESFSATAGQISFTLSETPANAATVQMFINGSKYEYGVDYNVSGTTVSYIGTDYTIQLNDVVEFWYLIPGGGSGGGETLAETLVLGNLTGGSDIIINGGTDFTIRTPIPGSPIGFKLFYDIDANTALPCSQIEMRAQTNIGTGAGGEFDVGSGSGGDGGSFSLTSGDATANGGEGGVIGIIAGDGYAGTTADGGSVIIRSGTAFGTGNAGDIEISGRESITGRGGSVNIGGGDTAGSNPGTVNLNGGDCSSTSGLASGGGVSLHAGDSSVNGSGGTVTITSGDGVGIGGNILNLCGDGATGGSFSTTGGAGTGGGGNISLTGGSNTAASGGNPGYVKLTGGAGTANNDSGGIVDIDGGAAHGSGTGGGIFINGGAGGLSGGGGGGFTFITGTSTGSARTGDFSLRTSNQTTGGDTGNISIASGNATSISVGVNSGNITLTIGDSYDDAGDINLVGGDSTVGSGSDIFLTPGDGVTAAEHGSIFLRDHTNAVIAEASGRSGLTAPFTVFTDVDIQGKLTVSGLIDPTGLVLDTQATVPGGTPAAGKSTFWIRSTDGYGIITDENGDDIVIDGVGGGAAVSQTLAQTLDVGNTTDGRSIDDTLTVNGDGYFDGKLTVTGLIDPTGIVLDTQATVPGGTPVAGKSTFWIRSTDGYGIITDENGDDTVLSGEGGGGSSNLTAPTVEEDGYIPIASNGDFSYLRGGADGEVVTWNESLLSWESQAVSGGGGTTVDTEWTAFTPVVTGSVSDPTGALAGHWRRVGDTMVIRMTCSYTGAQGGSGSYSFYLPDGYSIDLNKIDMPTSDVPYVMLGRGLYWDKSDASTPNREVYPAYNQSGVFYCLVEDSNNIMGSTIPATPAANDWYQLEWVVPIEGWGVGGGSGSVQIIDLLAGVSTNDGYGWEVIGSTEIDPSEYSFTTSTFECVLSSTDGYVDGNYIAQARLYNVTTASVVSDIIEVDGSASTLVSDVISLDSGSNIYEVQLRLSEDGGGTDFATCSMARIKLE